MKKALLASVITVLLLVPKAQAQVPRLLSYQGVVSQATDGVRSVEIRLYYDSVTQNAAYDNKLAVPSGEGIVFDDDRADSE